MYFGQPIKRKERAPFPVAIPLLMVASVVFLLVGAFPKANHIAVAKQSADGNLKVTPVSLRMTSSGKNP